MNLSLSPLFKSTPNLLLLNDNKIINYYLGHDLKAVVEALSFRYFIPNFPFLQSTRENGVLRGREH